MDVLEKLFPVDIDSLPASVDIRVSESGVAPIELDDLVFDRLTAVCATVKDDLAAHTVIEGIRVVRWQVSTALQKWASGAEEECTGRGEERRGAAPVIRAALC
jgi:hypothetical protein